MAFPGPESGLGAFSPVYVNDDLPLDFIETSEPFPARHFCFRVSEGQFDAIPGRIKAAGIEYRSGVRGTMDMRINTDFGGRLIYRHQPDGHHREILTVSYARQPRAGGERA